MNFKGPLSWLMLSIRRKLMLTYVVVIIIPLTIAATTMYNSSVSMMTQQTEKYNYKMLQLMSEKIDNFIFQLDRISYFVYLDENQRLLNNVPEDTTEYARWQLNIKNSINNWTGFLGFNGGIRGIILIKDSGVYFNAYDNIITQGIDITQSNWYKEAKDSSGIKIMLNAQEVDKYMVTKPYRDGSLNFAIARKVNNLHGSNSIGVLLIAVELYDIKNMLNELGISDSTELLITDRYNDIIYRMGLGKFQPDMPFIQEAQEGKSKVNTYIKNKILVNTFNSLNTSWNYITATDMNILAAGARKLSGLILLIGIFGFGIAVIMSAMFSKKIVIPIKNLQKSMKFIEKGDLDSHIHVYSQDEIGQLTETFNRMLKRIRELIYKVYKVEIKEKEANLNALQAQINPHFLYNTLDTVNAMAIIDGNEQISGMVIALGEMFKYSIRQKDKQVTIYEELQHLEYYVTIQKTRYGDRIKFIIDIPDNIKEFKIIKLILQPLVENAVHHGLEHKLGGGTINITGTVKDNQLYILIKDDGIGIQSEKLKLIQEKLSYKILVEEEESTTVNSIGLSNVNDRLKLCFGEQYGVFVESDYGLGTSITIIIPIVN